MGPEAHGQDAREPLPWAGPYSFSFRASEYTLERGCTLHGHGTPQTLSEEACLPLA